MLERSGTPRDNRAMTNPKRPRDPKAGVSKHVWSLEEIAALVPEPVAKKRGPYKKKAA